MRPTWAAARPWWIPAFKPVATLWAGQQPGREESQFCRVNSWALSSGGTRREVQGRGRQLSYVQVGLFKQDASGGKERQKQN